VIEGMTGLSVVMGSNDPTANETYMQSAGKGQANGGWRRVSFAINPSLLPELAQTDDPRQRVSDPPVSSS
jgi:hypothetical protein